MPDTMETFAIADQAAFMRAALRDKAAELAADAEELRRQAATRDSEREFYEGEAQKHDAAYESSVAALVAAGMEDKGVRSMVDFRAKAMRDAKVEVNLPSPERKGRAAPVKKPRSGRAEAPTDQRQDSQAAATDRTPVRDTGAAEGGDGAVGGERDGEAEAPYQGMALPPIEEATK